MATRWGEQNLTHDSESAEHSIKNINRVTTRPSWQLLLTTQEQEIT